jgi:hypothetical protein
MDSTTSAFHVAKVTKQQQQQQQQHNKKQASKLNRFSFNKHAGPVINACLEGPRGTLLGDDEGDEDEGLVRVRSRTVQQNVDGI